MNLNSYRQFPVVQNIRTLPSRGVCPQPSRLCGVFQLFPEGGLILLMARSAKVQIPHIWDAMSDKAKIMERRTCMLRAGNTLKSPFDPSYGHRLVTIAATTLAINNEYRDISCHRSSSFSVAVRRRRDSLSSATTHRDFLIHRSKD